MLIRNEIGSDIAKIRMIVTEAMMLLAQATGTEAEIIDRLRSRCRGAARIGDPGYYARFGFESFPGLRVGACPPQFALALPFTTALSA